jgi:hypothetical protein
MAQASGEYGGGEYYDGTMGDPGYSDPGYDYYSQDSDGDGWPDEDESNAGTDPYNPASYPGAVDPAEMDSDGDGLNDSQENSGFEIEVQVWVEDNLGYYNEQTGTIGFWMPFTEWVYPDPAKADTDGDLLPDGWEVSTPGFNPTSPADGLADPDLDGLGTGEEYLLGTAWQNPDSDGDGFLDGVEVLELGTDPTDADDPLPAEEPADDSGDSDVDGGMGGGGDSGGTGATGSDNTGGSGGSGNGNGGGTGGTQGGDGGSAEDSPPEGGGEFTPAYSLEVKGVQLDWHGITEHPGCSIIDEVMEYEYGGDGEITGMVMLVTCTCEEEPHSRDKHPHDGSGGGLFVPASGTVASLDRENNNDYEEYGPLAADFESRMAAAGGGAEVALPFVGGSGLGAWGGPTLTTAIASVSGRNSDDEVIQALGQRALVRMAADRAMESAVVRTYLSLHRKRARGTVEWEVVDSETVALRIPAGQTTSENAAVLAPPLEEGVVHEVTLIPVEIVPDYNRDGRIDDKDRGKVTKDNPWRWWVNDDDDSGEYDSSGADTPGQLPVTGNGVFVSGMRDLVDYFPLYLDLAQTLKIFPAGEYVYSMAREGTIGGIEFIETDLKPESVGDFLRKLDSPQSGTLDSAKALATARTIPVSQDGIPLSEEFLDKIKNDSNGIVLMDFEKVTDNPLILRIKKDGAKVADIKFPIKISNVEDMYRHVDLRTVPVNPDGGDAGNTASSLPTKTDDPGDPYPDTLTNKKYFVLVHGYNVNGEKARGWHAEIFKRLHQMGSRARFVGVSWRGDAGVGGIDLSFLDRNANYHKPVFFALQTGDALANALKFTGGKDVTIAAHSLGNMVVSHAIADGGFSPGRYYMIDAAVAAEAYDSGNVPGGQAYHMLERKWKPYLETVGGPGFRVTSARWYELFDDTDGRHDLKWADRFKGNKEISDVFHFYSTGEEVLQNPGPGEDSGMFFEAAANGLGRGSWVSQEFTKGTDYLASATQDFTGLVGMPSLQAGWGFAERYGSTQVIGPGEVVEFVVTPPSPTEAAALSEAELRENPIFREFLVGDLADPDLGSALAGQRLLKYQVLASGIPALSYAAGSNSIWGEDMKDQRFNMQERFMTDSEQWPTEGHEDDEAVNQWLHSDFYGVALSHVYLMYEKMIELGGLDDENEN